MAGMPKRRARREAAARQALTDKANALKEQTMPAPSNSKYSDELADKIAMMVADGTPIDDTKVGNDVQRHGIASMVGVSATTIYRWQLDHSDFAEKIKLAREESAHRHADQVQALSQLALDNPALTQAVKAASDNLKWLAMVRNRQFYSESRRIDLEVNTKDLGDRLLRAEQRVIEGEQVKLNGTTSNVDAEIIESVTTVQ